MPADNDKGDIRSIKVRKALCAAMSLLLRKSNFRKITVKDICEESRISRATFYSHFPDKYAFLRWWVIAMWPDRIITKGDNYEVNEQIGNKYIFDNKALIKNILADADSWTLDVLYDVLYSLLHLTSENETDEAANPKYIVLSNFFIGGMVQYILWQVKHDFPQDVRAINTYLFEIIKTFHEWINTEELI